MTTIIKAADAAEFLSLVPRMLGYQPTESLVMIPFAGARSLGALRFDLPGDDDSLDSIAATVLGMVCRLPEADAVAAVVYTAAGFADDGMPHQPLLAALERRADTCGLHTTDALCVAADGWGSRYDPALPDGGRPLAELDFLPVGADAVPPARGDQSDGATLPDVDLVRAERVGRALRAFDRAVELLCGDDDAPVPAGEASVDADRVDPTALATVCHLDDLPALFEDALAWQPDDLTPYQSAMLAWCLSRPSLRDVALVQWSGTMDDGDEAFEAQLRWESGEEYPVHLAMRLWGDGDRPDVERLERALTLARHVAAEAPRTSRPGPMAMCAWLSWALGRSTHADRYAAEACAIEPEHGLGEIVRSFVHAGHLPDWAFRRSSGAR